MYQMVSERISTIPVQSCGANSGVGEKVWRAGDADVADKGKAEPRLTFGSSLVVESPLSTIIVTEAAVIGRVCRRLGLEVKFTGVY